MGDPLNSRLSYFLNHCVDSERAAAIFHHDEDTCLPLLTGVHRQGLPQMYPLMQWTVIPPAWSGWKVRHICKWEAQPCVNPNCCVIEPLERVPKGRAHYLRGAADDWFDWELEQEYPNRLDLFRACTDGTIPAFAIVYDLDEYRSNHAEAEVAQILHKPGAGGRDAPFGRWERQSVRPVTGTQGGEADS